MLNKSDDTVIYMCNPGHYLAAGSYQLNCTADGFWNGTEPTCLPLDCGTPVITSDVQTDYTPGAGTTYGDRIEFVCSEGYNKKGKYWGTYECSETGLWGLTGTSYTGEIACDSDENYMGCYSMENFAASSQFSLTTANCKLKCMKENSRFFGLSGDTCFCGDVLIGPGVVTATDCSTACTDKKEWKPYFCGGPDNLVSVFTTRDLVIALPSAGSLTPSLTLGVYGDREFSCKQLCQAQRAFYAVLLEMSEGTECMCTNTTYNESTGAEPTAQPDQNITMYNLAKYSWREVSCSSLYTKLVRTNGWFLLKSKENPEYCSFADGTSCEEGWVGFAGSCYWFERTKLSFFDSRSHCMSINASLASLNNMDVISFASKFIQDFESEFSSSVWRFGATDPQLSSSYVWLDGNLRTGSYYNPDNPSFDHNDCLYLFGTMWIDNLCTDITPFICEKDPEMYRCVEFQNSPDVETVEFTHEQMNRQMCIQVCDGNLSVNALLKNKNCICTTTSIDSLVNYLPESACNIKCPGNSHQICGGSDAYSYKRDVSLTRASSCKDLENQGLGAITVMLSSSSQPTYCPQIECPFSWVKRPGHSSCYKFAFTKKTPLAASQYCALHHAHLVTFEEPEELDYLLGLLDDVGSFPTLTAYSFWIVGFWATSRYSLFYRSSTGKPIGNVSINVPTNEKFVYIDQTNTLRRHTSLKMNFICERSEEYIGTFLADSSVPVVLESSDMTVQLCVEICRAKNMTYAILSPIQCRCDFLPPENATNTGGVAVCSNSALQLCGYSTTVVSAYKIDEYPEYSSCEDLFDFGIREHGMYRLKEGPQYCHFYDNSTACERGWHALNGTCYSVLTTLNEQSVQEWRSSCGQSGGRLLTLNNQDQHQFISKLIMGSERSIKIAVLVGYSKSVLLGGHGWASGSLSDYIPDNTSLTQDSVLLHNKQFLNTDIGPSDASMAQAAVCETEKDFIGVYQPPVHLEPTIPGFGLMTLTQCKQVCIGGDHTVAMVSRDTCWCGTLADVTGLTQAPSGDSERLSSPVDTFCLGNNIQRCSSKDYVYAYQLDYDQDYPASSCDHLYSNGVYFNSTYNILNDNGLSKQNCGFADNTTCRSDLMFWGYKEKCYKFGNAVTSGNLHAAECFKDDSLPFLPENDDQLIAILRQMVPTFKQNISVFIGTSNRLNNYHFLSSEGFFVRSPPLMMSSSFNGFMTLNIESMTWEEVPGNYFGICKFPQNGSISCIDTSTINGSLVFEHLDISPLTTSICIQLCLGKDANFTVVLEGGCKCFSEVSYDHKFGQCKACSGHETQMCGDDNGNSGVLVNLDLYRNETAGSCDELYSYGINVPGQYYLSTHNTVYLVTCFDRVSSLSVITDYSVTPSSLDPNSTNQGFRIDAYTNLSAHTGWVPDGSDGAPSLTFTFTEDYLLTAIQTQGDVLSDSWVKVYQLISKYAGEETYVIMNNSINITGNTDRYSRVTQYFTYPVITRELALNPMSFNQRISLRVNLYGQPLANFNHSNRFLGCFLDPYGVFVEESSVLSDEDCKATCQISHQFYSYYETQDPSQHCFCGNSLYVYGKSETSYCSPNVSESYLPVYRTYDTYCDPRSEDYATLVSSTLPHTDQYPTVSSLLRYQCDVGFVLSDNTKTKSVTCREAAGIYYWEEDSGKCKVLNCSSLSGAGTWYDASSENVTYGSIVTVTCNSSLFMADGKTVKTVTCVDTGQWNDTVTPCTYTYCHLTPPTLSNGAFEVNAEGTNATYRCNQFYKLSTGNDRAYVPCLAHQQWQTPTFTCILNDTNVVYKQAEFDLVGLFKRQTSTSCMMSSHVSSSLFTCTDRCVKSTQCAAYSYNTQGRDCTLFNKTAHYTELSQNPAWKYFELKKVWMK